MLHMNRFFNLPLRMRIGIGGVLLLVVASFAYLRFLLGYTHQPPPGGLLSMGCILFLVWLAWDNLAAVPRLFWVASPVLLVVGAYHPMLLLIIVPAIFLLFFLRPSKKKP